MGAVAIGKDDFQQTIGKGGIVLIDSGPSRSRLQKSRAIRATFRIVRVFNP